MKKSEKLKSINESEIKEKAKGMPFGDYIPVFLDGTVGGCTSASTSYPYAKYVRIFSDDKIHDVEAKIGSLL